MIDTPTAEGLLYTQIAAIIVTILGFYMQNFRESRNRAWAEQDRKNAKNERDELAKKVNHDVEAIATNLNVGRDELIRQVRHSSNGVSNTVTLSRQMIEALLQVNNTLADKAYIEANGSNLKIERLTGALLTQGKESLATAKEIQSTGEEVQEDVKVVKEVVTQK